MPTVWSLPSTAGRSHASFPYEREFVDIIGSLRGKIEIRGDIMSTGLRWHADAES